MEILSSGSFINTDNQEKIEQLKFTALQLANATAEKDGFINEEEACKKLGLEFWQGLEYMCRDTEEAAIKNIFLSHFLERLAELRKTENMAKSDLPNESKAKDEFLGVLAEISEDEEEDEETIIAEERKAIIEEGSKRTVEFPALDNDSAENEESKPDDTVLSESKVELSGTLADETSKPDASNSNEKPQKEIVPKVFQLPEKESYQFDKCTVTSTIQLLPTDTDKRRAVLSVRTHDFAPQISVHEFTGEVNSANLLSALDGAFEKYKTDLPVKVMDKLKKEKDAGKKKSRKKPAKTETKEVAPNKSEEIKAVSKPEVKTSENVTPNVIIPKPEGSVQGSLFG